MTLLAQPVIRFCYNRSKTLFNFLSRNQAKQPRQKKKSLVSSIANASDFVDLCALNGYYAEEHIVQTGDGYLLGLHRLGWKKGEEALRVNAGKGSVSKRVVYLHHGLLMNSEVWVCLTDEARCLPFMLVEHGFDVWVSCAFYAEYIYCLLTEPSLGTIVEISTLKSLRVSPLDPMTFGTFPWINSRSMTFLTASNTFWPPLTNLRYPI